MGIALTIVRPKPAPARAHFPRFQIPSWLLLSLMTLAGSALVTLGFLYYIGLFTANFRSVRDNHLYRSAQMTPAHLRDTIDRYGIKTVLNLRGESRSGAWFKNERALCASRNIEFESIELDNDQLPHPDAVQRLVVRLEQGPFPLLIHCRRGADRTGLAAVLYLMIVESKSLDAAIDSQHTWHQGHINLRPDANDHFLRLYRETNAGQSMRDWIFRCYPAYFEKYDCGDLQCVAD